MAKTPSGNSNMEWAKYYHDKAQETLLALEHAKNEVNKGGDSDWVYNTMPKLQQDLQTYLALAKDYAGIQDMPTTQPQPGGKSTWNGYTWGPNNPLLDEMWKRSAQKVASSPEYQDALFKMNQGRLDTQLNRLKKGGR